MIQISLLAGLRVNNKQREEREHIKGCERDLSVAAGGELTYHCPAVRQNTDQNHFFIVLYFLFPVLLTINLLFE